MASNIFKVILLAVTVKLSTCSITGLSYMDPSKPKLGQPPGSNPCNPLYWYPRALPDYCYTTTTAPAPPPAPPPLIPLPIPVPMPLPVPLPYPPYVPPISYGIPEPPSPMLPVVGMPYPPQPPPQGQIGMVPGIPGIVSRDGGINVLPFSDAYSDVLEKHKNKMIRKRMREVFSDYEYYPRWRRQKRRRRRRKFRYDSDF